MEIDLNKNKQLTFDQRCKIEEMLNKRRRKFEIANELDKSQSTISREINRHKILKHYKPINGNFYNCKFFINCKLSLLFLAIGLLKLSSATALSNVLLCLLIYTATILSVRKSFHSSIE